MVEGLGVRAILVPYDSGHRGARMGRGPEHLLANGLSGALSPNRNEVHQVVVKSESILPAEVATAFELDRLVSLEVRAAIEAGEFPLVLSGNCNASLGTLGGIGSSSRLGIVWFDAHADFNTPETTTTGFTDGMGLAIAVGHCWSATAASIPTFNPLAESNVVLVGARDVSRAERNRLDDSEILIVGAELAEREGLPEALAAALDALRSRVGSVYVHLDLDVLDAESVGPANEFAVRGGLTREELEDAISMIRDRFTVAAAGIASYDPALDGTGAVLQAGLACARALVCPPRV
jgi:arginase